MKESFSPPLPLLSISPLLLFSHSLPQYFQETHSMNAQNAWWFWPCKGDDAHKSASMEPLGGEVRLLTSRNGEESQQQQLRPAVHHHTCVRALSKPERCSQEATLSTPAVLLPSSSRSKPFLSLSTWHGDVKAVCRSTLILGRSVHWKNLKYLGGAR